MSSINTKAHTDIKKLPWIEDILPEHLRPYAYLMRIDRPIGIWLLLLPGLWAIFLSSNGIYNISFYKIFVVILFVIGATLMRGAGCIINDLWDRDLDKLVERTQNRPIASGDVSVKNSLMLLATLLLISLFILMQFNLTTVVLGFVTIPLIISYPAMKRITWWPQAFLGLTFNFSALMGWSAVAGLVEYPALLLYCAGIFWTLGYDTIYAHQDKEDDVLAGIKSTALKFGAYSKIWVCGFYVMSIVCFLAAYLMTKGPTFMILIGILPILHLSWQMKNWQPEDAASSLETFKANRNFGLLVLLLCML